MLFNFTYWTDFKLPYGPGLGAVPASHCEQPSAGKEAVHAEELMNLGRESSSRAATYAVGKERAKRGNSWTEQRRVT